MRVRVQVEVNEEIFEYESDDRMNVFSNRYEMAAALLDSGVLKIKRSMGLQTGESA